MRQERHPHTKREKRHPRIEGIISATPKGLGFVKDLASEDDIRIEVGLLGSALHRDLVEVEMLPGTVRGQRIGRVTKVVKRARTRFVGAMRNEGNVWYIDPDDKRIYTAFLVKDPRDARENDKVLFMMRSWEPKAPYPEAEVLEVIGQKGVHDVEMRSIILAKGIDDRFPDEVHREAELQANRSISDADVRERTDFRGTTTFTVDPTDAKDFDDALSVAIHGDGGATIGIHIADVSHYVLPGSPLDTEARSRAFSTYLVDRTVPMLPEVLSNGICSLNPDVDRLTFSVWFDVSHDGSFSAPRFGRTIIHSDKRFTYEEAQETLDAGRGLYFGELSLLNRLAKRMREGRERAGSIDFEQHEVRFELADDGVPLSVYRKARLDTHKLIEEFMLLANKSVAEYFRDLSKGAKHSSIYRVHDHPDREKLKDLADFVKALGHRLELAKNGDVTGTALNRLFKEVENKPEEGIVKTAGLRSMAKAAYATLNIGHFGLALPAYTHFTSPIRRYADLMVHRFLADALKRGTTTADGFAEHTKTAAGISEREIDVIGAERDSIKYKQVEYMSTRIGQEFEGLISGVSEFGFFVEETTTKAEGLIRLNTLSDDYYSLEPKKYRIVGQRHKKQYALGEKVRVKLMA
ncbi:MAG TPA: ribonuclease R, partial [Candidatus Paceibacterota bacterium]|nr:ribonuclease R [Candidatus Paceibacterota bacterium]